MIVVVCTYEDSEWEIPVHQFAPYETRENPSDFLKRLSKLDQDWNLIENSYGDLDIENLKHYHILQIKDSSEHLINREDYLMNLLNVQYYPYIS